MKFLVELETTRDIPEITDLIAGRIYTLNGVDISKDVTVSKVEEVPRTEYKSAFDGMMLEGISRTHWMVK